MLDTVLCPTKIVIKWYQIQPYLALSVEENVLLLTSLESLRWILSEMSEEEW